MELKDFLNSINLDKKNLLRGNPVAVKAYPAFVVSRCLSYHQALIPLLDMLNECRNIDALAHYEFLLNSIPISKRYAKWTKPTLDEDITVVSTVYNCSRQKAEEYLAFISEDQLKQMKDFFQEGGLIKKRKEK